MIPPRPTSRLPIAGVLVVAVVVLVRLLLFYGADRRGVTPLPGPDGSTVDYFADHGAKLTLADVERLPPGDWQHWSDAGYVAIVGRNQALWLRVTLRNPGERPQRGVWENDDFFADRLDAWIGQGGDRVHVLSGEQVPATEKALPGREVAVPVTVPARGEEVLVVRIADFFGEFARPVWWPDERAFQVARSHAGVAEGVYLGGLMALLGFNTLLWLRLRLREIGLYVLYLGSAAVFVLLARAHLPALGWAVGSPRLETVLTMAMALSGFFLTRFARVFLELETTLPRVDRWVRRWSGVLLALAAGALTMPWLEHPWWMALVILTVGGTHPGLLILAVMAWRAGVRQARFFLLSFGCLFAGSLPMVVVWFAKGLLRDTAMRGLMVGSALEMLLLSLAVADWFMHAQRRLIEETEQRRLIEETYAEELEIEVRERTRDLEEANTDKDRMLAVLGHDLRGPLTGLMRSADETAGEFARETARTGRSLLLLIEDLVLWARLRAGTPFVATHPARALVAPAVALHHSLAERAGTELILAVPDDLRVAADLVLAQTLVRNLLANALKFARTRVVLRAAVDAPGRVRFTVGNDGPTLSAEVAARIAADEAGPITATGGLGLRLCREICRALGTKLEARTAADGGTEFGFILPAVPTTTAVTA